MTHHHVESNGDIWLERTDDTAGLNWEEALLCAKTGATFAILWSGTEIPIHSWVIDQLQEGGFRHERGPNYASGPTSEDFATVGENARNIADAIVFDNIAIEDGETLGTLLEKIINANAYIPGTREAFENKYEQALDAPPFAGLEIPWEALKESLIFKKKDGSFEEIPDEALKMLAEALQQGLIYRPLGKAYVLQVPEGVSIQLTDGETPLYTVEGPGFLLKDAVSGKVRVLGSNESGKYQPVEAGKTIEDAPDMRFTDKAMQSKFEEECVLSRQRRYDGGRVYNGTESLRGL